MTDTDLIAKAEALASADYPGIAATVEWKAARDRHLIALVREPIVAHAQRLAEELWHFALGPKNVALPLMIPSIEIALAKAEERGAERGREACAGVADDFQGSAALERADDPCGAVGQEIAAAILARGGL